MTFRFGNGDVPPPWAPFIPPFDPPGSESPSMPVEPDPPEGSSTDDETSISGSRPDWWPEDWPWRPESRPLENKERSSHRVFPDEVALPKQPPRFAAIFARQME